MRLRTLLILLAIFAFVALLASTIAMNQSQVVVRLGWVRPMTVQLWAVMLIAFGAGAALILFFDIAGGARRVARNWKAKKLHRAHEKVEDVYRRGLRDLENGRAAEALARFEEVLSSEPHHVNALMKRGDSLRALGRYRDAVASLEQAIRLVPDNLVALYHLSDVYLDAGDPVRAEEVLRRIVRLDPKTTVSAHRKLRDLKVKQRDWLAADQLQSSLGEMLTLPGEREEARAVALGIRYELGSQQLERGDPKAALSSLATALKWDSGFVPAYIKLGEAHRASGQPEQAVASWWQGYRATGSPELLLALEEHYLEAERPEEAIAVWKQAISEATDPTPLRYCLGKLHHRLFMLDEALREFRKVEERVESLPSLHVHIARILESKGDLRGALSEFEALVDRVGEELMDYRCRSCQRRYAAWTKHCESCKHWNTVVLDVRAAVMPEPTIRPAPTWSTP
jgi:lipopolysaccharide biosynthesis regulator YciM